MRERVTKIALILLILVCAFAVVACTDNPPACTHVYTEKADAAYLKSAATCMERAVYFKSCSLCGDKGTETFEYGEPLGHAYGDWISNGDGTHTKTCANDAAHKIDENCSGGTANCTERAICEVCNMQYGPFKEHTFSSDWSFNDTHHWKKATCGCDLKKDYEGHDIGADGICSVCEKSVGPTSGVKYGISEDGKYAIVVGYEGKQKDIRIASTYENLPVTRIENEAFYFSMITSVTIPDSVTSIGKRAFYVCELMKTISIPTSVTSIEEYAFWGCQMLEKVIYAGTIDQWVQINFEQNASPCCGNVFAGLYIGGSLATEINITSASKISDYVFQHNAFLRRVTIGDSVTSIGKKAFNTCYDLTSVTINGGATSIGEWAFEGCEKLVEVINKSKLDIKKGSTDNGMVAYYALIVHDGASMLTTKDDYVFLSVDGVYYLVDYVGTKSDLVLPANYNGEEYVINRYAFYYATSLKNVTLPSWVTEISEGAFYGCVYLTNVTFPDQLESIGAYSFMGCYSLVSVTIPSKVTDIGERAFFCCWKLAEVVNNSKLNIIKDSNDKSYIGAYALTVHDGTSKIVSNKDYMFLTVDGVDYLLGYVGTNTSLTLPADYDGKKYVVYDYAFYYRISLTKVVIGDGVSKIGETAFGYCLLLSDLTIGDSVTEIAYGAFGECVSLTNVVIPVSVESLGSCAFIDCGSLETITIGNGVKSIGERAFHNCFALTTVYYQGTAEQWAKISIGEYNSYLTNAKKYYYSETEPALNSAGTAYDGNYWHYDNDGNIVVWIYKSQEND